MGRIIGLIGCTCLVIFALRMTNYQYTDHTLKGGEDRAAVGRETPRVHYKLGKELYLRGKYHEAARHLTAAIEPGTGLTTSERRQVDEYLARVRARLQDSAAGQTVRAQSDAVWEQSDEPASAPKSMPMHQSEAVRAMVDRHMSEARKALKQGDRAEATKRAQLANQIARDAKMTFSEKEVSPAAFLAQLQKPANAPKQSSVTTANSTGPDWAADDLTVGNTSASRQSIRQTSAESDATSTTPPMGAAGQPGTAGLPLSAREQATALVAQARADIKAKRYDEARQKALIADELDVFYDLFEDRPELVLNDLDRLTQTKTIARNGAKPKSTSPAVASERSGDRTDTGTHPASATTASAKPNPKRVQAIRLLELARKDIEIGNLEAAQSKAEQAEKLNAVFEIFDDTPELALSDIAARRAAEGLADTRNSKKTSADPSTVAVKPQAMALLAKARQALTEDRLVEARQLAVEAERLKAPYDLFDDRPDLVLEDVARVARRGPISPGTPISQSKTKLPEEAVTQTNSTAPAIPAAPATDLNNDSPAYNPVPGVNSVAARQTLSPAQAEAIDLLRQARQLMKAGRYDEARAKAEEAEQRNVTFPVFADRPDLVLSDLDAKMGLRSIAARNKAARNSDLSISSTVVSATGDDVSTAGNLQDAPVDPNANPFVPQNPRGRVTDASARRYDDVVQADSVGEITSANELYNRGMRELNRGNRDAAYSAFLAAHQTGQKLDYVRTQRLQDYLRELAPRHTRTGIQQVANQVQDNDIAQLPNNHQPAPLDAAQQEYMVRFDRLRTEVLNAVFKAERLKATDPETGLTLIDQTMAKVEGADLPEDSTASLMKQLNKSRSSLQGEMVRQMPNLEQKKRNKEVEDSVAKSIETAKRVEQEFAKLVEEFNDLFKQQRYAEAEIVAKKAKALNPKDPVAEQIYWKAVLGRRVASNDKLQRDKEASFWGQLNDVEESVIVAVNDKNPLNFGEDWKAISARRKGRYPADNRKRNAEELRIEQSLTKRISLHEDGVPLAEVIKKIHAVADVNIVLDTPGLEEEGVGSNVPVSIDVDGIQVKSALNLILTRYNLGYIIENEVLKITSRMRQQGDLVVRTYSVADLVIPIPDAGNQPTDPFGWMSNNQVNHNNTGAQFSVPASSNGFAQVGQNQNGGFDATHPTRRQRGNSTEPDFTSLTELIVSTIAPDSWDQVGGPASIKSHESTLSLVIRQTQKVHEEIVDLMDQLRRLQDLQVTIEVRFVTVSDYFFERIGVDFNFNIQPTTGLPTVDNNGLPLQQFGSVTLPNFGLNGSISNQAGQAGGGGQAQQGAAQQGAAGQQAGAAGGQQAQAGGQQAAAAQQFFGAGPALNLYNNPAPGTIVGMKNATNFTNDLTVPFQQGSFQVGVPTFGNYNPQAGMEMGMAILSDIEAFFFIQAAQGDQRNNLLFAPKVTVFNGQTGTVSDAKNRPFVTSLTPTVGFASVGFQPQITTIPEGITMSVTAVVSSDRRFVRLSVFPQFNSITDVFTFSFVGGGGQGGGGGNQAGGQAGGGQQGGGGGFGGGGGAAGGAGGFGGGQFGIGGGLGGQGGGGGGGGFGGGGGQAGGGGGQGGGQAGGGGRAAGTITVQQPVVERVTVITTVSVPDGGTILLGGIKRLKEGRNMSGVPILNKIPYLSRLFKNTGVGRETESLMLMVTPRIIIQEEEEELLGIPKT